MKWYEKSETVAAVETRREERSRKFEKTMRRYKRRVEAATRNARLVVVR